ncbi:hypothetical protein Tco_0578244, partial [Tanacetum coccineum]
LTRTGRIPVNTARPSSTNKVSTARQNSSQAVLTSVAKKVNTVRPKMNDNRPKTIFHKVHSPFKRPFNRPTTSKANTVKASASWVWKPKHEELNHVFKSNSALKTLTRYDYVDALGSTAGNLVNTASIKRLVLLDIYAASALYVCTAFVVRESFNAPDLWIVVLRIGKLQGIGEFSGVGFILTQQMVINSPCLTDTKNWLFQCKRHLLASPKQTALELAIPGQTATGKESSNPFMAGSLPKTIHFCDSLQSDEDSFELIKLMILCTNFLTMGRIDDADAEVTFIDETSNDARNKNNKISNTCKLSFTDACSYHILKLWLAFKITFSCLNGVAKTCENLAKDSNSYLKSKGSIEDFVSFREMITSQLQGKLWLYDEVRLGQFGYVWCVNGGTGEWRWGGGEVGEEVVLVTVGRSVGAEWWV